MLLMKLSLSCSEEKYMKEEKYALNIKSCPLKTGRSNRGVEAELFSQHFPSVWNVSRPTDVILKTECLMWDLRKKTVEALFCCIFSVRTHLRLSVISRERLRARSAF